MNPKFLYKRSLGQITEPRFMFSLQLSFLWAAFGTEWFGPAIFHDGRSESIMSGAVSEKIDFRGTPVTLCIQNQSTPKLSYHWMARPISKKWLAFCFFTWLDWSWVFYYNVRAQTISSIIHQTWRVSYILHRNSTVWCWQKQTFLADKQP